jgi:hypothetical protein
VGRPGIGLVSAIGEADPAFPSDGQLKPEHLGESAVLFGETLPVLGVVVAVDTL